MPTHWDKESPKDSKSETEIRSIITVFNIYLFNILVDSRQRTSIIKRNRWNKFREEKIKYSLFVGNDYIARKYQFYKLSEIISEFVKVIAIKVNMQKSIVHYIY